MSKGKLSHVLAVLLALAMILPLAACTTSSPTTAPTTAAAATTEATAAPTTEAAEATTAAAESTPAAAALDLYNLRILTAGDQPPDQQSVLDAVAAQTKDTLNVNITVDYFPWADYINKVKMMSAAKEKFDICLTFSGVDSQAYSNQEMIALDDLLQKYGQNLLKNITESNWVWAKGPDGKTIAVPCQYAKDGIYTTFVVRKDLREKYSCPEITSWDTLAQYLDAVAKNEKDITPLLGGSIAAAVTHENERLFGTDWQAGYTAQGPTIGYWATKGDNAYKVVNYYESEQAKENMKLGAEAMNRGWYAKDLNKGENGYDQTAISSGKVACLQMDYYNFNTIYNNAQKANPNFQLEWALVNKGAAVPAETCNNFAQVSATSEKPERAVMFLDWIQASQDNYDMWYYGIKGKHFNLTADGVVEYIGTADNTALPYNPTPWWFRNYKMDRSVSTDCDMTKTAQDYWKNATVLPVSPTAAFAFDINPVNLQVTQVIAVVQQYWNDLANGVLQGDDNYQTFLKALNDAGMPDIITEMQKQLDKYRADHSIS